VNLRSFDKACCNPQYGDPDDAHFIRDLNAAANLAERAIAFNPNLAFAGPRAAESTGNRPVAPVLAEILICLD